jgi:hypothetical protein
VVPSTSSKDFEENYHTLGNPEEGKDALEKYKEVRLYSAVYPILLFFPTFDTHY